MASLQEDVKLDCSYKVLAEDKPMLSNYTPKLHRKAEGVESLAEDLPRMKNSRSNSELQNKQERKKTKEIIYS